MARRKGVSGKPDRSRPDRPRAQTAQVVSQNSDLLEFSAGPGNGRASFGKAQEKVACRRRKSDRFGGRRIGAGVWRRAGGGPGQRQHQLFTLAQGLGIVTEASQSLGKIRGKSVQRQHLSRLDPFDHVQQVREIRMIAQRKGRVRLIAVAAIRIHRPAG